MTCTAIKFSELCNSILSPVPELYQPATYHVSEDGSFEIVDEKTAEKVKSLSRMQLIQCGEFGALLSLQTKHIDRYLEILHYWEENAQIFHLYFTISKGYPASRKIFCCTL